MFEKYNNINPDVYPDASASVMQAQINEAGNIRGMEALIFLLMLMSIVPWLFGRYEFWGFYITGWAWVLPTAVAGMICIANIKRIAFPVRLWLPWLGTVLLYWIFGRDNPAATQSLLQIIAPLVVGCAASIFNPGSLNLEAVIRWITRLAWIVWILLFIRFLFIPSGLLPDFELVSATLMICILLLGACYSTFYVCGSRRHLIYYLVMLALTVFASIRGPILAMSSCLPLTLAPLKARTRIIMCVCFIIFAVIIFNTDRMQQRMFHSGQGVVKDLSLDNPDLRTSGRTAIWNILWAGIVKEPWIGHGWNFHRVSLPISGIPTYQPHNDWLRLLYDIGIVGTSIYLITIILQIFSLTRIARWTTGAHRMLAYGLATAFVPYMIIMFTDNVILYVQFFGNLHFALIGIVYGAMRHGDE